MNVEEAKSQLEEMFNSLDRSPYSGMNIRGFILTICFDEQIGTNSSNEILELTDSEKIDIIINILKNLKMDDLDFNLIMGL